MATLYSDQMTDQRQTAPNKYVSALDTTARVRCAYFKWTADAAQNDVVELVKLPVGARILRGRVDFTDFGTAITLSIGDETTAAKYLSAADIATAAGQADFANTVALGMGSIMTAATTPKYPGYVTVQATIAGGDPASGTLEGYVMYAVVS